MEVLVFVVVILDYVACNVTVGRWWREGRKRCRKKCFDSPSPLGCGVSYRLMPMFCAPNVNKMVSFPKYTVSRYQVLN
jgi:hypothetical protein